jgi:CheY-like chemotaxis protein
MNPRDESSPRPASPFDAPPPETTGVRLAALDASRQDVIARSERTGAPGIDVRTVPLDLADLDAVPRELARRHLALPLLVREDTLLVAMAEPASESAVQELEFVTGKRIYAFAAEPEALRALVERAYELREAGGVELSPERPSVAPPPPVPRAGVPPLGRAGPPPVPAGSATASPNPGATVTRRLRAPTPFLPTGAASARGGSSSRTSMLPAPTRACLALVGEGVAEALREGIATMGFAVNVQSSIVDALARAASQPPELLVIDLGLPGPHGFDVVRRVRAQEGLARVPLVVTADQSLGWRRERDLAETLGVGAVLTQPFTPADVVLKVSRCLVPDAPVDEALPPDAEAAMRWSNEAWARGDLQTAVSHLERATLAAGDSYRLHYHLGLALGRQGEVFRAADALERSVALHDGYFPAIKNLAVLYERAGFRHAALEAWERAFRIAPDDVTREQIKARVIALLA